MSAAGLSAIGPGAPRVPRVPRAARRGRARRGRWRGLALAVSLLLHLAAGWWLLVGFERRPVREPAEASAMDVLFDGGAPEESPAPPPEAASAPLDPPSEAALPEPPAPMPRLAEPPAAPPLPAPPAAAPPAAAPPAAAPPAPVPPLPALAEAPPPPAPPLPRAAPSLPLPSAPAPSDLAPPPPAEAPAQRTETAALPLPPPPPEPPPPEPAPQAQLTPSPSPPRPRAAPANPFAGALDLSQGPPISLGRPAAPSPSASSSLSRRNRDSTSSSAAEADAPNAQLRIRGAQLGADWRSAFMAWLRQHGYYPRQAAEAGEDGTAVVRFSVDRSGQVSGVQLIGRSGSIWLDAGAQALLRGRSVPPFPPGTREDSAEIDLTINYILRRR